MSKPTIFISYSHKDVAWKNRLVTHLRALELHRNSLTFWTDEAIAMGDDWLERIQDAMSAASVAIMLISPDFLASEFISRKEMQRLLERREQDQMPIFPILVQPCVWKRVPWLSRLQMRPANAKALSKGTSHRVNEALAGIVEEIATALERVAVSTSQPPPVEMPVPQQEEAHGQAESVIVPIEKPPLVTLNQTVSSPHLASTPKDSLGMELILIPAGEFLMGANDGDMDEKPAHRVRITRPFYLAKYPTTQAQWEAVMGSNPSRFKGDPNRPVENVSWDDVQEFLRRLTEKEGKSYRLPTEAEWEYAARAGTTTAYCFGDDPKLLREYGWYVENSEQTTHPIGQRKSNAWGLHDVHGNVWEWVNDWFDEAYYQKSPPEDPQGPEDGQYRVVRGGSWFYGARSLRVSTRRRSGPGYRSVRLGFRCAV